MSASPADMTPGRTPGRTPNGGMPLIIRKKKAASDPLVRPKDRNKRRPPRSAHVSDTASLSSKISGVRLNSGTGPNTLATRSSRSTTPQLARPPVSKENATSGFSSAPIAQFADYPLILTKKALFEGMRYHVARFASKKAINPCDSEEFVRPVRLHRRDPRATRNNEADSRAVDGTTGLTELEREAEMRAIARAERDAHREAEMALVAPAASGSQNKRLGINLKKTEQVMRTDITDEQKAKSKLRYEEALPWHLEDFDNKSTWVGSYEAALSSSYAMMVQGADGAFRITPVEKWYKFTTKAPFQSITAEEAELRFRKKVKEPRWFADSEEAQRRKKDEMDNKKSSSGLFIGKWERGAKIGGTAVPTVRAEDADGDDLDFTEDRFADDEENMVFEEDDETKEAAERIKRDQLQANIFDLKEEKEYDKKEQIELKNKEAERKLGKRVKKALMKREKNYIYDSDSGENPYSSSSDSDSDSTATERLKAEEAEKNKEDVAMRSTPDKKGDRSKSLHGGKSKPSSGLGSGANTPSHRSSKHQGVSSGSGILSRTASSTNIKRPGSPLPSDASGNESSRRKSKKVKHLGISSQTELASSSASHTPRTGSPSLQFNTSSNTAHNPANSVVVPSKRVRGSGLGGSDSEGPSHSSHGGSFDTDNARKRLKLRLTLGSRDASPDTSRATSPVQQPGIANDTAQPSEQTGIPTAAEIRARIPATGISISNLLAFFRGRIAGQEQHKEFTRLMKGNARFDKEKRILLPLS